MVTAAHKRNSSCCHNEFRRQSRNVWVDRSLPAVSSCIQIYRMKLGLPAVTTVNSSLQSHPERNWKDQTKQEVSHVFRSNGRKITIYANKKIVNFLDVAFDFTDLSYKPYMKPNNWKYCTFTSRATTPYITKKHSINKRLTNIPSSKEVFDESIAPTPASTERMWICPQANIHMTVHQIQLWEARLPIRRKMPSDKCHL